MLKRSQILLEKLTVIITFKSTLSIVLALMLINLITPSHALGAYAGEQQPNQQQDAAKVKSAVAQLGANPDVHVEATLGDGKKVKGYISSIDADSFSVTKEGTTKTTIINYADVVKIEKRSAKLPGRHSSFWPILVGMGIVIFAVVVYAKSDRPG